MDAGEPDPPGTLERLDDQTTMRRRSRRVSFAETTAVHIFKRDEDYDTPPDATPGSGSSTGSEFFVRGSFAFAGGSQSEDDDSNSKGSAFRESVRDADGGDTEDEEQELFVKDMVDSSPGSAVGSVTSNDDYNLFGPVSSSFISPGRLSEVSDDDNRDITLDSMTFSMHFRNVLATDDLSAISAGSLMTPTGDSITTSPGNSLSLAGPRMETAGAISSGGNNTHSDMSFVTQISKKYDYEKLPPPLEALLLQVDEFMDTTLPPKSDNNCVASHPSEHYIDSLDSRNNEPTRTDDVVKLANVVDNSGINQGALCDKLVPTETHLISLPDCQTKPMASISVESKICDIEKDQLRGISYKLYSSPLSVSQDSTLMNSDGQKRASKHPDHRLDTPNSVKGIPSPSEGSIASLSNKRQQLFLDHSTSSKGLLPSTPFRGLSASYSKMDTSKHWDRLSAIKNSISKLRSLTSAKGVLVRSKSSLSSRKHLQSEFEAASERSMDLSTSINDKISTTSSDDHLGTVNLRIQTPSKEVYQSISNIMLPPVHQRDSILTLNQHSWLSHDSHRDIDASWISFPVPETDTVGKKRRIEELPLEDKNHMNGTERMPKNQRTVSEVKGCVSGLSPGSSVAYEVCKIGLLVPAKHWKDIFSKVSGIASQQTLVPLNTLNLGEVDIFEERLNNIQRARKFERLCSDIQSLIEKKHDKLGHEHQERVAEVKLLHDMIVYERVKLQLLKAKRDGLSKETKHLRSGIEECCILKSAFIKKYQCSGRITTMRNYLQPTSVQANISNQDGQNKLESMRVELKSLEEKLKGSRILFETSCKIQENTSFDEIIKAVNDHLKLQSTCRLILEELLLWKLVDIVNGKHQCDILLSYQNVLSQRFTVKTIPRLSLYFRNSVNVVNIGKKFPNMGASTAFDFVFNTEDDCRLADPKCFRQETQMTSFVLGNLLDFLEEVQSAQFETPNLISSNFNSPHTFRLELELSFLNLKTDTKIMLTLDMTNLKCGIYPTEPVELQIRISGGKKVLPYSVSDEILCAIRGLRGGNSMFGDLLRCVSHIVQSCA